MKKFTKYQKLFFASESRKCSMEYFLSMKRKDGREEFIHSDRLAQITIYQILKVFPFWHRIYRSKLLDKILAVEYLHDVPENISLKAIDDIKGSFKNVVSMWVWALTIKKELGKGESESFREIAKRIVTIVIKLVDKLHNLRNMSNNLGKDEDFFTKKRLRDQIDVIWKEVPGLVEEALKHNSILTPVVIVIFKELIDVIYEAECKLEQ